MKKRLLFFIIVLFSTFFFAPIHCYADESAKYTFITYIDDWYKEDELIYHCSSSYGTDHYIAITAGDNHYFYNSCEDIAINELLDGFHDPDDYIQDINIHEDVIVTDFDQDTVVLSSPYLELTDTDFDDTPIKNRIFQDYHPGDYTVDIAALKEKYPDYMLMYGPIFDNELSYINLGIVDCVNMSASYQFVVRGDLADPSGQFVVSIPGEEPLYYSSGDTYHIADNLLSLTQMKSLLEEKPEIVYTNVYNDQDYSVSYHLLSGEGLNAIQPDPEYEDEEDYHLIPWVLNFEVEARNDSEIANTGLLYDIGPFILLGIVFIAFFIVFKKNKIKEDHEEIMEKLH